MRIRSINQIVEATFDDEPSHQLTKGDVAMKKSLLTLAALMLLALGSLAMSSDQPAAQADQQDCQFASCCPIPCPR
jgi:hypothetical protein